MTNDSLYCLASSVLQKVLNKKGSIKSLCLAPHIQNKKKLFALVSQTMKYMSILQFIVTDSNVLDKEPKLSKPLAYVLLYELLFSRHHQLQCGGWMKFLIKRNEPEFLLALEKILKQYEVKNVNELSDHIEKNTALIQPCLPRYARVNTLKCSLHEVILCFEKEGWTYVGILNEVVPSLKPLSFGSDPLLPSFLLVFPSGTDLHDHTLILSGQLILQDKASCLPPVALNPPLHSHCIDACSAPGNKTSFLSQLLNNKGQIHAFELNSTRFQLLKQRLKLMHCENVAFYHQDFLTTSPSQYPKVTHILVDPSCSGSGIHLDTEKEGFQDRLAQLAQFQIKVILHAMKFPNAQKIVYSTCSIHKEENELVVHSILSQRSEFKLSNHLFPEWPHRGLINTELPSQEALKLMRLGSHNGTHGFFICLFERVSEGTSSSPPSSPTSLTTTTTTTASSSSSSLLLLSSSSSSLLNLNSSSTLTLFKKKELQAPVQVQDPSKKRKKKMKPSQRKSIL